MARSFQSNDLHEGLHESSSERTQTLKAQSQRNDRMSGTSEGLSVNLRNQPRRC